MDLTSIYSFLGHLISRIFLTRFALTFPWTTQSKSNFWLALYLLLPGPSNPRAIFDSLCTYSSLDHPFYKDFVDFVCTFPYHSHSQPWFSWTFNKLTYLQVICHLNFCWSVLYLLFSRSLHLHYFMEQLCKFFCLDCSIDAALMNRLQDFIKFNRYIGNKLLGK